MSPEWCDCAATYSNGVPYPNTEGQYPDVHVVGTSGFAFGNDQTWGCKKGCPFSSNNLKGVSLECGYHTGLNSDETEVMLCSPSVTANSSTPVNCSCNQTTTTTSWFATPRFLRVNATDGTCTLYCNNCPDGGCDPPTWGGACMCASGWEGHNCDINRCLNGGHFDTSTGDCVCVTPYTGSSCATTTCTPGTYTPGSPICTCSYPYMAGPSFTCVSACGFHGTISGDACSCDALTTGSLCTTSLCNATRGGLLTDTNHTNCACVFDQWKGPLCNNNTCVAGYPYNTTQNGCECYNDEWKGSICDVDLCLGGHATNSNDTEGTCICDEGYTKVNGLCQPVACGGFGVVTPCEVSPTSCPCGYTCACGDAAAFLECECQMNETACGVNGNPVVTDNEAVCSCDPGFSGDTCQTADCPASSNQFYNTTSSSCACLPIWITYPACTTDICKAHNQDSDPSGLTCVCPDKFAHNVYRKVNNNKTLVSSIVCLIDCDYDGTQSVDDTKGVCNCKTTYQDTTLCDQIIPPVGNTNSTSSGLSTGAIAGIAVGAVLGTAVVGGVVVWVVYCVRHGSSVVISTVGTGSHSHVKYKQIPQNENLRQRRTKHHRKIRIEDTPEDDSGSEYRF